VASKYFREIVDDINTGTPIEDALENAMEFNASSKLKRILWQLLGAIKTGAEVTQSLRSILAAITAEQIIEIKEYGRKLNSFMMFYLVMAVVAPSLGLTMIVILSSFLELAIDRSIFFVMLFFLVVVQTAFVVVIRASRPMVNL
jgi:flagellar protein FlaJ